MLKDSPAEKAGLLENDVVVRFGDAQVNDFCALTTLLSKRKPGEEVELEIVRSKLDGTKSVLETAIVKVTLASWPLEVAVRNVRP